MEKLVKKYLVIKLSNNFILKIEKIIKNFIKNVKKTKKLKKKKFSVQPIHCI